MSTVLEKKPNPSPSTIPMTDPRYPIWGRLFLCKVPRIAHYSTNYLERFGMHTSGFQEVDIELAKAPQTVYITIDKMVEYYHSHHKVTIVKQKDIKIIYEICQDYTFNYAEMIGRTIFTHNTPLEDLVKIDEFAEALYQYAGHAYGKDFARSFLPEKYNTEVQSLHSMFDAVDQRLKERHKKVDEYTVIDRPTNHRRDDTIIMTDDEDRQPLPARPSSKDLFLSYMRS